MHFLTLWKEKKFKDEEQSDHALKSFFLVTFYLFIFILWVKLFINVGTMPSIDFMCWLGLCYRRRVIFCVIFF